MIDHKILHALQFISLMLFAIFIFLLMALLHARQYSPEDVRDACWKNQGVQQIETRSYRAAEAAIVVCKDGAVSWVY